MEMSESILIALIGVIGGTFGTAIVNAVNERWKVKQCRKAALEDKQEEKQDKTDEITAEFHEFKEEEAAVHKGCADKFDSIEEQNSALAKGLKVILLDRILYLGQRYIADGEVSFEDRRILHLMHDVYHDELNGNGDADLVMTAVDKLPLKH